MTAKAAPITTALHPQQDRFLRLADVEFLTGLRRASIYALGKAGTFPKAVHITCYSVAWRKSELKAWMAERLAMRDGERWGLCRALKARVRLLQFPALP